MIVLTILLNRFYLLSMVNKKCTVGHFKNVQSNKLKSLNPNLSD